MYGIIDLISKQEAGIRVIIDVLGLVIAPSVVAALISAYVSNRNADKSARLERITDERKKWREAIRNLVLELDKAEGDEIHSVLTQIKVRINAIGQVDDDFDFDGYLWRCIDILDDACRAENVEGIAFAKESLIRAFSILLKADWEKAKAELETFLQRVRGCFGRKKRNRELKKTAEKVLQDIEMNSVKAVKTVNDQCEELEANRKS